MNQLVPRATIKQIRQSYDLTAQDIAERAGVPLRVEYLMEIGCPVNKNDAVKVMRALSTLTGSSYTLANTTINVQ